MARDMRGNGIELVLTLSSRPTLALLRVRCYCAEPFLRLRHVEEPWLSQDDHVVP